MGPNRVVTSNSAAFLVFAARYRHELVGSTRNQGYTCSKHDPYKTQTAAKVVLHLSTSVLTTNHSRGGYSSGIERMTAKSSFRQPVGFSVEYFDPVADSLRTFVLTVFPDNKVQMVSV